MITLSLALAEAGSAVVVAILSLICTKHTKRKIAKYEALWEERARVEKEAAARKKAQATKQLAAEMEKLSNTQAKMLQTLETQNPFVRADRSRSKPKAKPKPTVVEPPKEVAPQLPIERFYDEPRIE